MLKVYGADLSTYSNKVRFTANALNLEYEYVKVSLRDGENRKPEYLGLHPAGKIPVIDDAGFVLFESNAIIKYLTTKHGSELYPKDLKTRALIDQWIDFVTLHVGGAIDRIVFNRVFAPRIGAPVDERSAKTGTAFLNRFLPIVDKQLNKNTYLVGEKMTIGDINLLATLDSCEVAHIKLSSHESIVRLRDQLKGRDFYTKCHLCYEDVFRRVFG